MTKATTLKWIFLTKLCKIKLWKVLKILDGKTWRRIIEVTDDEYFKQSDVKFTKEFLLKFRKEVNVSHFIPVDVKKSIQQIGFEYIFIYQIVKIKRTIVGETYMA